MTAKEYFSLSTVLGLYEGAMCESVRLLPMFRRPCWTDAGIQKTTTADIEWERGWVLAHVLGEDEFGSQAQAQLH